MGITRQQTLDCFASADLIGIGMEADLVRRALHPERVVSYTIEQPFDISLSQLDHQIQSAGKSAPMGATGLVLPGADKPNPVQPNPAQPGPARPSLAQYETLLAAIKQRLPAIHLHGLSATQIVALAAASQLSLRDTLLRLHKAGLGSIASGAVILNDQIRNRIAPHKCSTAEWIGVHRTAHQLGITTSASMVFGVGETMDQRIDHLEILRDIQQEAGGFVSFTPLPYQHRTASASLSKDATNPTAVEYLKTLAVSRLFLDNIQNLQGSWATQGLKVLQMGLRFGANDVGSVLLEDHFGKPGGATEEELRRIIREAGFRPAQRDTLYRTMFLN